MAGARLTTFTVVVIAYNRRVFLETALNSAIHQRFPVARREIVVVRNFDGPLPPDVDGRPLRDIRPQRSEEGAYADAPLDASTGDVVVFLDDDDLWEEGRLEWLAEKFGTDPNLGFVRNGIRFVDRSGAPLAGHYGEEDRRVRAVTRGRPWSAARIDLSNRDHRALVLSLPGNNSSVAVRRAALDPVRSYLRRVMMIDSFSFYAAMAAGCGILVDPSSVQTAIRVHGEHISHATADSFREFPPRYSAAMTHFAEDWAVVHEMLGELKRLDLQAACDAERRKFDYFVTLANHGPRSDVARLLRTEYRARLHAPGRWRSSAWLALLSPSLSLRLSYRLEQRRWRGPAAIPRS